MSELADFRPGDMVKSVALGIGRVSRVDKNAVTILYYGNSERPMKGVYSLAWFTAHPDNLQVIPQEALEVA